MKLTGTYNGKPIELELTEEQVEVLKQAEKKKTGWERVKKSWLCFCHNAYNECAYASEFGGEATDKLFDCANYFSDETLAKNIIRAQTLQRKLWRRSAELCDKVDWTNKDIKKYCIRYAYENNNLYANTRWTCRGFGEIYFDTEEHAEQVIKEFRDELIWYFTKFESRMD